MDFVLLKVSLFFHTHSHSHLSCPHILPGAKGAPYRSALKVCPQLSFWDLSSLPMMVLFTYCTCHSLMIEV